MMEIPKGTNRIPLREFYKQPEEFGLEMKDINRSFFDKGAVSWENHAANEASPEKPCQGQAKSHVHVEHLAGWLGSDISAKNLGCA